MAAEGGEYGLVRLKEWKAERSRSKSERMNKDCETGER